MLSPPGSRHSSLISETVDRFILDGYVVQGEKITDKWSILQDVKITPAAMEFQRAFEGRKYYQKLTIQNCGRERAFIRICPASSYAFEIKPLVRGIYLPPGLSLIRYITYTYMRATAVPLAWVPIHINEAELDYKLIVSLSEVMISAIPQQIDFGTIDAGHSTAVRMLSLRNDGSKGTRFAIDLGRNEIELIVEPSKGIIQPHDTVTFRVECLGTTDGSFSREFWVKCDTPLRIGVKGKIIIQQLYSIHPNTTQDFTLIDFPKTYFGTHCTRTLVLKNFSAMAAAYCTLAELKNENMNLEEAAKHRPDYLNFQVTPLEGSLVPHEARIFQFTYTPMKDTSRRKQQRYEKTSFCCIRIIRIPCMDLGQVIIPEKATVQDQESLSRSMTTEDTLSAASHDEIESLKEFQGVIACPETTLALSNIVRVILYGEAESAGITIRPDSLHLLDIPSNTPATRELLLVNQSSALPIIFDYKKTCCVNVEPSSGLLPPSGKLEVCVIITPVKIGKVDTKIVFDLLYFNRPKEPQVYVLVGRAEIPLAFYVPSVTTCLIPRFNMGITPTYIKEVGFFTDDVRFNSSVKMPRATLVYNINKTFNKEDSDLIAFPNDMPKSLRPWKTPTKCRTICAGIPRAVTAIRDTYELSESKSDLKRREYSYYKNYIKQEGERLRRLHHVTKLRLSEYDVSNKLLKNIPKPKCPGVKNDEVKLPFTFIPLTPLQLNKIKVYPTDIKLGKMAPKSAATRTVTIHNLNDFSIRIFAKSRKPVIDFPDGDHKIVKPFTKVEMQVTYNSGVTGRYNVILDFIVNDNNTFAVWITVDVVPKCVKFNNEDIIFESDKRLQRYLDVYNPVNVPIAFQWHVPDSCFIIEPLSAIIPPHRHITCLASYIPHHINPSGAEITLFSENGRHQTVNVVANFNKATVTLKHSKVVFDNLPLNLPMQGTNILKNLGYELVTFSVLNPEPMAGISISPSEGVFHGCAEQLFNISLKISACISFTCTVEIEVQRVKIIKFQICGNVIYPRIEIKPEILQLRKILPNSFERQVFVIINKSTTTATIEFCLEDYTEYKILETHDFNSKADAVTKIQLEGKEQKELYLYFVPMGAASYRFYLPMLINDIIGPAYMNKPDTLKTSFYTETVEKEYLNLSNTKSLAMPKIVSTLTVSTAVGGDMLRFSKLHLNFKYMPYSKENLETHADLKIWNASKNTCKFCIRIDELTAPFSLTYVAGNEIETLPYSIVCVLGPKEDLTLRAEFLPHFPGTYCIKLPIYLRHYLEGSVFNYLSFTGWFPPPTISALEMNICLEPVPLKCETEYSFFLTTEYHPLTCKVLAKTDISEMRIDFTDETISEETKPTKEVRVLLKCCIKTPKFFDANILFFCNCDAECYVNIKGFSDNCTVTTHPFLQTYTKTLFNQSLFNTRSVLISPLETESSPDIGKSFDGNTDTLSTLYSTANVFELNINYNETSFPMFPDEHDATDYAKYMRSSIIALEEWLFHQGFYAAYYYKIPEGIATAPEPKKSGKVADDKKKKETFAVLKYVELLTTLVGPQINKYVPIRKIPVDDINRINYMYNVYANAKEFISIQGGLLPHVGPENLLCYNDYVVFMNSIYPLREECHEANAAELMDEQKFYRMSKQSWMDMLLQTYKVFVLARVRLPHDLTEIGSNATKTSEESNVKSYTSSTLSQTTFMVPTENFIKEPGSQVSLYKSQDIAFYNKNADENPKIMEDIAFWQELSQSDPRISNIFNESETILLHWLQFHFNRQREVLWGPNGLHPSSNIPDARNIRFFGVDLTDGLVLIAITSIYCPYLIPHLADIYLNPTCAEQAFHNASKLLQSWNMVGLSFTLTPKQIVNPNDLQMLMLVNYLYEVLPGFYPHHTINFKTGLSEYCSESVAIENLSNFPVTYTVIFFKNDRRAFSVPKDFVNLRPRQKTKMQVKFNANRISLENVIMVLNGETPKRNYAKSMAFVLIGEPIPSHATTVVTIPAPLYQLREATLQIQSPYKGAHSYDLYYAVEEPLDIRTCKIMPWATEKRRTVPKRIISNAIKRDFDEEGMGILEITICCVTTNEKSYWIIFRNHDVGDFTIKIVTIPEIASKIYTAVPVSLPQDFNSFQCSCKSNNLEAHKQCPRTIIIPIPCRNDMLWNAVTESMMKIVDEKDLPFWQQYLGTNAGIQINKWIAEDPKNETSYDIQEIFDSRVNYNIIIEDSSGKISAPPTTTIQNVHSFEYHGIPIHFKAGGRNFNFTLESERGLELRHYSVYFISKKEQDNEMQLPSECTIIDFL